MSNLAFVDWRKRWKCRVLAFYTQKSEVVPASQTERRAETNRARKKPININIFGGTMSGTNRNRPWDKRDPSLGQNGTPSLGQTGLSLLNSTVKSPFCPVCPWDGWGFVPGTIVPQGPSENCLCVFCLLVFFAPKRKVHEFHPLVWIRVFFLGKTSTIHMSNFGSNLPTQKVHEPTFICWPRGSTGVQRYGRIPWSAANNLGEIPKKSGSSKSLVLKSFWVERTFGDSSLLVSLTLWDTPVLFTPPLPLRPFFGLPERLLKRKRVLLYMGKIGSIYHFPRALPASIWGHCSQVLVFTSIWDTQKGVWQWHFSCCFCLRLGILGPSNTAKQWKMQNDKSTLLYPPTGFCSPPNDKNGGRHPGKNLVYQKQVLATALFHFHNLPAPLPAPLPTPPFPPAPLLPSFLPALFLVNLLLIRLVRISWFSSLFLAIAVLSAHLAREW